MSGLRMTASLAGMSTAARAFLIFCLGASWAVAQGGVFRSYQVGGVDVFFTAIGSELRWGAAGQYVVSSIPVQEVGCAAMTQLPSGEVVIAGQHGAMGRLLRLQILPGQSQASVVQQLDVGAIDPEGLVYHPTHGLLLLDNTNGLLFGVPLSQGALATPSLLCDFSATPVYRPWRLHIGDDASIETVGAVYGMSLIGDEVHGELRYLFSPPATAGGLWQWTLASFVASGFAGNGWGVIDANLQGVDGSLAVTNFGGGAFQLVRVSDGVAVFGGTVPANGIGVLQLPTGALQAGESYRVEGGGHPNSKVFWPSFRRGANLMVDDVSLPKVALDNENFEVGKELRIEGALKWSGQVETSVVPIAYFLWATIGEPAPGVTTDLPDGRSFITQPLVMWTGDKPAVIPKRVTRTLDYVLPIDANDDLVDTPLLFQWIAVSPSGTLVLSDVFGSTIRKGSAQAAAQVGPVSGGQLSPAVLLSRRRSWLRSCSSKGGTATLNSLRNHLATSPMSPWSQ